MSAALLTLVAAAFLVMTGANEGGVIATTGMHHPSLRPLGAVFALSCGVVLIPMVLGTRVAQTLALGLIGTGVADRRLVFGIGLCTTLVVVGALTVRRLPTSLSLALVGSIAGAALGAGLPVAWFHVATVLAFSVVIPIAGALVGGTCAFLLRCFNGRRWAAEGIGTAGLAGYLAQVVAYGANGGQKMIAVCAVVGSAHGMSARPSWRELLIIGGCFGLGSLMSIRRLATRFRRDLVPLCPPQELAAELASAFAIMASTGASMPVSTTQVTASAIVGAGAVNGPRRVRWQSVARLGSAWLVTLPACILLAAAAGVASRPLT